ncbi:MAG: hypothetical protein HY650_10240 [Acidobacteria bacterium]|nr:hypothetical protein [Acidobacteriota bacterium]
MKTLAVRAALIPLILSGACLSGLSLQSVHGFADLGEPALNAGENLRLETGVVNGLMVDRYTWRDSAGRPRSASLVRYGQPTGGYAIQLTYQVQENSRWRTVYLNPPQFRGDAGFGYFVSHELYRTFDAKVCPDGSNYCTIAAVHNEDDSPLSLGLPGSGRTVSVTGDQAVHEFTLNYPHWGTTIPVADHLRFETNSAPLPAGDPDTFAAGEVDVVTLVRTTEGRRPISPFIYGINGWASTGFPSDVLAAVTLVRRGGDRGNSYNWETNVSNGSYNNGFVNDMTLGIGTPDPNAPASQDLALLEQHRPAGRAVMVPFVLQDWVSGPRGGIGAYDQPGWNRSQFFRRVGFVKPTAYAATPDLNDGMSYSDEHLNFMRNRYPGLDITAPLPGQMLIGIDNEPDLYHYNFPMLQSGLGAPILAGNGQRIGTRVTSREFTDRMISFARRVKQIAPLSHIVGPSHYHFDGWTTWHDENTVEYSSQGRWYMDDFLSAVKAASEQAGKRLLDTWDFHWYPQGISAGTYVWNLDHRARPLTQAEIDQVVQSPRSYWDPTYDENSWITSRDHLNGPGYIISRLQQRIAASYPGTKIGVTEYFPGGRNHISSGLAVADSLGVFQRLGVNLAALWPVGSASDLAYAYGALKLLRNADGNGLRYADTNVRVEHPEVVQTSVYAGSDTLQRVTVLVINKTIAARRLGVRLFNPERLTRVDAYRIDAANPSPYLAAQEAVTKVNAYAYSAPPLSATMLVFTNPDSGDLTPGNPVLHKKYDLPVTIRWTFTKGRDEPLWSVTYDFRAAPVNTVSADIRGPYGYLVFDEIDGPLTALEWGDKYLFRTQDNTVSTQSRWTWNTVNTGHRYNLLVAGQYEMGLVETVPFSASRLGSGYTDDRNETSTSHQGCPDAGWRMPCDWEWSYQSVQYEEFDTRPTRAKKLAWGTAPYLGSNRTFDDMGEPFAGYPVVSHSVWITFDKSAGAKTRSLAASK